MKFLLTGGAGYIGSHTCIELVKAGHEPVIVDDFSNASETVLVRIKEICGREISCYHADIRDKEALRAIFSEHSFDGVIHFAGFKAVGESVQQPLEYYRNNLDTTLSLCEVMREYGIYRIVFSSSATVYGSSDNPPYVEEMPSSGCTNPYGWTKYMNEQILRDIAAANPNWSVVLLRYFNPIGAHESGLIGEDPVGIPNNLMPYVTKVASGELKELTVFGNDYPTPDGTGVRDYIHVVDLAQGHVKACEYLMNMTGCEVINLGTGRGTSVLELITTFEQVTGMKIPYRIGPRRAGDLANSWADVSKAKTVLSWEAQKTIVDMCKDAWHWQRNNPRGYRD